MVDFILTYPQSKVPEEPTLPNQTMFESLYATELVVAQSSKNLVCFGRVGQAVREADIG